MNIAFVRYLSLQLSVHFRLVNYHYARTYEFAIRLVQQRLDVQCSDKSLVAESNRYLASLIVRHHHRENPFCDFHFNQYFSDKFPPRTLHPMHSP